MSKHVPIHGLFETHLTVSDLQRSIAFYRDIVGLQLALEVSERNAAFFWIGDHSSYYSRHSMLGLWSVGTAPLGLNLHVAFEVAAINDFLEAPKRLKDQGIMPLSFFGKESLEPSVIGWMPAAAIYFRDPDGHLMEYLTMLDDKERRPDLGIVSWSEWITNNRQTA
ncbi:MAG: VOC family protein [Nitrososphaeraceae archaeon]|nr:VOC family protein [Nitrososphaeraceae archaeon]